ncbi:MAG TPA: hypothetical protein VFZ70_06235 [Euzebyales bacterium]
MDMIERRIREAVATVLSRGAKALEQTATELERAADELRTDLRSVREDADAVWSEPRREADTMTRSAPLRAVPDTPTDEAHVPPVRPPQTPSGPRRGDVDADVVTAVDAPDLQVEAEPDGLRGLATGTVSEIRARLPELTQEQLRSLRGIEVSNRNRTTLLTAIDRALDSGD